MRLALDPRARRLLRRVPRTTVYSALELALLSLLAIQCARLVWTIVTPLGPVGEWRAESALRPLLPNAAALLGQFDPFFRLSDTGGPAVVTSLNLKLYGVREDRASGRGSAIIATPDGQQKSFAVGDEIVPGVTLAGVSFDSVTISRGGVTEQLFLDQSSAAPVVAPTPPPLVTVPAAPAVAPPPPPPGGLADIRFQPRLSNGRVTGVIVQPQGSGNDFRAAGLAPGDVILSVNGERISSAEQARAIGSRIGAGEVTLQVDRGGRTIPLKVKVGQ